MKEKINRLTQSGFFYLPFKIFEGVVGILALSLYTRLFGKEVFGSYSVVNAGTTLIAILCTGWLRFVTVRYIKDYSSENDRGSFMSGVFTSYIISALLGGIALYINLYIVVQNLNLSSFLFYLSFYFGYTLSQLFVDLLLYDDKRKANIIIVTSASVLKPLAVISLYFLKFNPYLSIIFGHGIIDIFFGIYSIRLLEIFKNFSFKSIDKSLILEFVKYGFPLIGLTLTMYVLNVADRFVILYFFDKSTVGVYSANYTISASLFTFLTLGLSKGFYPKLLSKWNAKDLKGAESVLSISTRNYLYLALPASIGLSFVSYDLSKILFGQDYSAGTDVIMITAISMFFFGISEYFNKGYELTKNSFQILKNSFIVAVLKIILNFIFIPMYGFIWASYTTLICFVLYSIICYLRRVKTIKFCIKPAFLIRLLISNLIMFLILYFVLINFQAGIKRLLLLVLSGMLSYAFLTLTIMRKELR